MMQQLLLLQLLRLFNILIEVGVIVVMGSLLRPQLTLLQLLSLLLLLLQWRQWRRLQLLQGLLMLWMGLWWQSRLRFWIFLLLPMLLCLWKHFRF